MPYCFCCLHCPSRCQGRPTFPQTHLGARAKSWTTSYWLDRRTRSHWLEALGAGQTPGCSSRALPVTTVLPGNCTTNHQPPTTNDATDSRNALDARVREPGPQCLPWIAIPITDLSSLLLSSDAAPRYLSIMWSCRAPLAPDWLLPRPSPPFPLSAADYLRAMLLSIVKLYQSRALLGMSFLA
jgi:hypothetical protein